MSMLKRLATAVVLTAEDIGPAIALDKTPWLGGQGRNGVIELEAAPGGAAVIEFQGHNGLDEDGAITDAPAEDDGNWETIATFEADTPLKAEVSLPAFIRWNITTLGTGVMTADLRGVQ